MVVSLSLIKKRQNDRLCSLCLGIWALVDSARAEKFYAITDSKVCSKIFINFSINLSEC